MIVCLRIVGFLTWTFVCAASALLGSLCLGRRRNYPFMRWAQRMWGVGTAKIFGCKLFIRYVDNKQNFHTTKNKPALVIANHRSPFDIAILLSLFGGHMVSRHDLAKWPVVGWAAGVIGTIFVDRASSSSGAAAVRAMARALREKETVLIFPEGTTCAGDSVLPFHHGAFVAMGSVENSEVIPIGIVYEAGLEFTEVSFKEYLKRVSRRHAPKVGVVVGVPLHLSGNAKQRAIAAQKAVQDLVLQARTLLGSNQ